MRSGFMTAKELADLEHVQPQSLTRMLGDLEEGGFIHREQAEADRRQVQIKISAKGRDLLVLDARRQDAWLKRRNCRGADGFRAGHPYSGCAASGPVIRRAHNAGRRNRKAACA